MKTRLEELDEMLDNLDDEIRAKYPEIENTWLHDIIAKKVKFEIERAKLIA